MDATDEGYATGGKDGCTKLWDNDFKAITSIDLTAVTEGYPGMCACIASFFVSKKICFMNSAGATSPKAARNRFTEGRTKRIIHFLKGECPLSQYGCCGQSVVTQTLRI